MSNNSKEKNSIFDPKIDIGNSSFMEFGDRNVAKPAKAMLGLSLLVAIALALYGFNVMRHSTVVQTLGTASSVNTPYVNTAHLNTTHLAPQEDHSLQ